MDIREPNGQFPGAQFRLVQGQFHDLFADIVGDAVPHPAQTIGAVLEASLAEGPYQ
jgi:hypothetical protein